MTWTSDKVFDMPRGMLIKTKFLGPTNHRGSRVKASHKRDSERTWAATVDWDHALGVVENHYRAARKLCVELNLANNYYHFTIQAYGFDNDHYYFLTEARARGAKAA